MNEWLEEMELEVEEDVGVVQNTQLEQETQTYKGYLPLEMNDAGNNNVSRRKREMSYHKMIGVDRCI